MASNPLSVDSILSQMADALPTHQKDDTNSDLSSSYEAIALFCHACMVAVGFRLVGFGEGQKMGWYSYPFSLSQLTISLEAECENLAPRLSPKWNSSFGSHSFLYTHSQSSMQYVVKVDRMGGKAEVRGIGLGDERISRLEIVAKDYISQSALPLRISLNSDGTEDRSDLKTKLQTLFISESRIKDLTSLFKGTIIQKLIPNLNKEGYEESNDVAASAAAEAHDSREEAYARRNPPANDPLRDPALPEPARPYPFDDPFAQPPRRPIPDFPPPGFEDEYEMQRPPRHYGPLAGQNPYNIGHDDLNPPGLGPHDPLRGSFVGGGPAHPGGFGGMHPTFDDPLFAGRGGGGGYGQGGYDPQVPEGARYDPVGPGDGVPRQAGRGGFPGGGGGGQQGGPGDLGNRPPNPFGGYGGNDFI
jgi:hypothetical protein